MDRNSPEGEGRRAKIWKASPGAKNGRILVEAGSETSVAASLRLDEVGSDLARKLLLKLPSRRKRT